MTRDELLADFRVLAAAHFGCVLDEKTESLLAKLAIDVPDEALEPKTALYSSNTVYLVGMIEEENSVEIIGELMQVHLNRPVSEPLNLVISSEGGDVAAGMAIGSTITQIRRAGREVRGHVAGLAHSAAFDVLQLCDHRSAEPTSFVMLHEEQYGSEGSSSANLEEAKYSKRQVAAYLKAVLCERTGLSVDFYKGKIANKNWYLSAEEAMAAGFLDEIIPIPPFKPIAVVAQPRRRRSRKEE